MTVIIDPSTAQDYPAGTDNIPAATLPISLPLPNPPTFPNNAVSTDPLDAIGGMTFVDTGVNHAHIVGDTDHYYAYYAVTDVFGISHLYVVNPSTGNAIGGKTSFFNPVDINTEGAFGPFDGSMYMNPPQSSTGLITQSDVGTVTGLATVTRSRPNPRFPGRVANQQCHDLHHHRRGSHRDVRVRVLLSHQHGHEYSGPHQLDRRRRHRGRESERRHQWPDGQSAAIERHHAIGRELHQRLRRLRGDRRHVDGRSLRPARRRQLDLWRHRHRAIHHDQHRLR